MEKKIKFINTKKIKNNNDYNKLINLYVFRCWTLIASILVIAYIIEVIKNLRTPIYVLIFSIFTLGPLIACNIIHKKLGKENINIKYFISIGYIVFYSYALFTAQSLLTWVYIVPMSAALVVYNDKKLLKQLYQAIIVLNIFDILSKIIFLEKNKTTLSSQEILSCYEIQIACVLLSGIFLYYSCKCLAVREKILFQLQEEIYIDSLTDCYNKKFLLEKIPTIFAENKKYCLAFIDIDNFKKFNDNYSHEFGDIVIKNTCNIAKEKIKNIKDTYLIRVGGDEFIIISKMKDYDNFIKILEEIREEIHFSKLKYDKESVSIHVSIGAANSIDDNCDDYLDLYRKADLKLYKAKESGKNTLAK